MAVCVTLPCIGTTAVRGFSLSVTTGSERTSSAPRPVTVVPPADTVPVTVCGPSRVAAQVAPRHEPSGSMRKVVRVATSSSIGLPQASLPTASKRCCCPGVTTPGGSTANRASGPGCTTTDSVALIRRPATSTDPVTVCRPALVVVHVAPLQEPSGPIVKVVLAVTSPTDAPVASAPRARNDCGAPAVGVPDVRTTRVARPGGRGGGVGPLVGPLVDRWSDRWSDQRSDRGSGPGWARGPATRPPRRRPRSR